MPTAPIQEDTSSQRGVQCGAGDTGGDVGASTFPPQLLTALAELGSLHTFLCPTVPSSGPPLRRPTVTFQLSELVDSLMSSLARHPHTLFSALSRPPSPAGGAPWVTLSPPPPAQPLHAVPTPASPDASLHTCSLSGRRAHCTCKAGRGQAGEDTEPRTTQPCPPLAPRVSRKTAEGPRRQM